MKTMKDQVTSIEQSKRLIELGGGARGQGEHGVQEEIHQKRLRAGYGEPGNEGYRPCLHGRRPAGVVTSDIEELGIVKKERPKMIIIDINNR